MRRVMGILVLCLVFAPAAHATFPGENGKLAFENGGTIWVVSPDTSTQAPITSGTDPAWSPDGNRIAFAHQGDIFTISPAGTGIQLVADSASTGGDYSEPAWDPRGGRIVFTRTACDGGACDISLLMVLVGASEVSPFHTNTCNAAAADWAPNGGRIAFWDEWIDFLCNGTQVDIFTVEQPNGTNQTRVTFDGNLDNPNMQPSWSPNNQKILFRRVGTDAGLFTVNPDGTGRSPVTGDEGVNGRARWSPDGTRIAFPRSNGGQHQLWSMNLDGSGGMGAFESATPIRSPDWQPIPINGYARPRGATPFTVSMVPAYAHCSSPNRTHGPPLAFPSCGPPAQLSDELTVGTADANGKPAKSRGYVSYEAIAGSPATPGDQADVKITVELFDIYEQGTLADYAGELRSQTQLRITDKYNMPHPAANGLGAGTVTDAFLGATVPCAPTSDATEGAFCSLATTMDSLVPNAVVEGQRAIWALGAAYLADGGADNDADTGADNTLFMTQGLFVP